MTGLSREEIAQIVNNDYIANNYKPRVNAINSVEARDNAVDEVKRAARNYYLMNDPRGNGIPIEELHPEVARNAPQRLFDAIDLYTAPIVGNGLVKAAANIPALVLANQRTQPLKYFISKYGNAIRDAGYILGREQAEDVTTQNALNYALPK